ncbi:MAG: long-chain fatty acid--CoA ligase [Gammaproteobacteria bacterium]|nr:long-chain fatty acid--CoA ligase [Gammaproteobacteria bacterium]
MLTKDSFSDWLVEQAQAHGDRVAVINIDTGRQLTYREFNERATRLATGLQQDYNVHRGDRVAMLAHNSSDIFETLFACWKLGAIFVPLNWRLSPGEISQLLDHGEPAVILADHAFGIPFKTDIPVIIRKPGEKDCAYEALIRTHQATVVMPDMAPDDTHLILYTSGTTGPPKGVIYTYRMTMHIVMNANRHGNISQNTRTLTYLPLFHTAGLNGCALPVFFYGGQLLIMQRWDAQQTLQYLSDPGLGITHCIGVPTNYIMMAELPEFADIEFPALKYLGIGSAPVPIGLLETWEAKGVDLVQSYGMTEAFCVSLTPPDQAREKLGSAGQALTEIEIRIGDDLGNQVPVGETGEVQLRGPGVTPGYWKEPELTASAFIDDWFRTGDAARIEADGTLYIVDRFKDMWISGGENVYPSEVEDVISRFPEVQQVAIISIPDPKWGETGLALIVLRDGYNLTPDEIRGRCRAELAAYKTPGKIEFVDSLPLSPQGKVLKRALRQQYNTGKKNV